MVTVLFSCPNPVGDILAKQIADEDAPNIAVTSPMDGCGLAVIKLDD